MKADFYTLTVSKAQLDQLREILLNAQPIEVGSNSQVGNAFTNPPPNEGAWMNEPATERQLALLEKRGIRHKPNLTKGEASKIIDDLFRNQPRNR